MRRLSFLYSSCRPAGCPKKLAGFLLVLLSVPLLAGCGPKHPDVTAITEPLEEPVVSIPKPLSPGTLYTGDDGNWLADVKAHRIGDIVTILIKEQATASKVATTDTERSSNIAAGISSLFGLEKSVGSNVNPSALIGANSDNKFSGTGKTTRAENLVATLTTQVIEVYPNGNMKIRGGKSVTVNNENQIIYLTGIVRLYDVMPDNTVDSGSILNAQISYTGKGAVSDNQKPGWMGRIFDNVWPF
jgi:flagellar L-ring protein precursor FlgH